MKNMTAAQLLRGIGDADTRPALQDIIITGVQTDSRKVQPGALFVAIRANAATATGTRHRRWQMARCLSWATVPCRRSPGWMLRAICRQRIFWTP